MSCFRLDGHVALVTGSTTGLGRAIAGVLGQAGAKVVVNVRAQHGAGRGGSGGVPSHRHRMHSGSGRCHG